MLSIGKKQKLVTVKKVKFGIYLAESVQAGETERVLLPARQVPEGTKEGDWLTVFLYRDSDDRPIATTREPKLTLGGLAVLTVKEVTRIGAFLDWGLEKDLFLPYREQTKPLQKGEEALVSLYLDKSGRLCATMKVYHYLKQNSPYGIGDTVKGRIYEISGNFGVFAAVDDQYSGLVPKQEAQGSFSVGEIRTFRVTEVKEDGKLNLSTRNKAYLQLDEDSEHVMRVIGGYAGVLPFDDKASPEVIQREFGLSKAAFKRAVGHLLKEGRVSIRGGRIWKEQ